MYAAWIIIIILYAYSKLLLYYDVLFAMIQSLNLTLQHFLTPAAEEGSKFRGGLISQQEKFSMIKN